MLRYSTNDIVSYLVTKLERDPRVDLHHSPITVSIKHGRVLLEGQVNNIAEKRAAMDTTTRMLSKLGHWHVVDRLHVKPTQRRQDVELMHAVLSTLRNESAFENYSLLTRVAEHVEVQRDMGVGSMAMIAMIKHGCVTLAGQVQSLSHKRLAEVLMWWTDGCEFVDNQLQIVPAERDTDNEIADAVRIVLEKDPLVHASQLMVGTAGSVVILNGSLASKGEKQLAVRDTWYVPGVSDVVDRIQARG